MELTTRHPSLEPWTVETNHRTSNQTFGFSFRFPTARTGSLMTPTGMKLHNFDGHHWCLDALLNFSWQCIYHPSLGTWQMTLCVQCKGHHLWLLPKLTCLSCGSGEVHCLGALLLAITEKLTTSDRSLPLFRAIDAASLPGTFFRVWCHCSNIIC